MDWTTLLKKLVGALVAGLTMAAIYMVAMEMLWPPVRGVTLSYYMFREDVAFGAGFALATLLFTLQKTKEQAP